MTRTLAAVGTASPGPPTAQLQAPTGPVRTALEELAGGLVDAVPELLAGAIFLVLAALAIKLVLWAVRVVLRRTVPDDQELLVDLGAAVAGLFLWFGVALAFLKIVGMGDVAASLGTAAGFLALGVSYALSNMIADVVAGVYLLRDPDFETGDTVVADGITGDVTDIGLRKSRLRTADGNVVVLANRDVDKKWTKRPAATDTTGD